MSAKIFPRPLVRNPDGVKMSTISKFAHYAELRNTFDHAQGWSTEDTEDEVYQLALIIFLNVTLLELIGYDENKRSELFKSIEEEFAKQGCFEEFSDESWNN